MLSVLRGVQTHPPHLIDAETKMLRKRPREGNSSSVWSRTKEFCGGSTRPRLVFFPYPRPPPRGSPAVLRLPAEAFGSPLAQVIVSVEFSKQAPSLETALTKHAGLIRNKTNLFKTVPPKGGGRATLFSCVVRTGLAWKGGKTGSWSCLRHFTAA